MTEKQKGELYQKLIKFAQAADGAELDRYSEYGVKESERPIPEENEREMLKVLDEAKADFPLAIAVKGRSYNKILAETAIKRMAWFEKWFGVP